MFGISVAKKKLLWLKRRVEDVAGHGSQPNDQNPNDRLTRALARLLSEPSPTAPFAALDTMKKRIGPLAANGFTNAIQRSTIAIERLVFLATIETSLAELDAGNCVPHDEAKRRLGL